MDMLTRCDGCNHGSQGQLELQTSQYFRSRLQAEGTNDGLAQRLAHAVGSMTYREVPGANDESGPKGLLAKSSLAHCSKQKARIYGLGCCPFVQVLEMANDLFLREFNVCEVGLEGVSVEILLQALRHAIRVIDNHPP